MVQTKILLGLGTVLGSFKGFKVYRIVKHKTQSSSQILFNVNAALGSKLFNVDDELIFDTIISSEVTADSQVISIPIEEGYRQTDGKYIDPRTVNLIGIIERSSSATLQLLSFMNKNEYIENVRNVLEIMRTGKRQTKDQTNQNSLTGYDIYTRNSGVLRNFTLKSYKIIENANNFSLFHVEMEWQEILEKARSYSNSKNASASSTQATGQAKSSLAI